jgi:hypothetical protein
MINSVRNTVLSIISKDNRGYITPMEFNLYAKQAQLEIFENMFYMYSKAVNKQNNRYTPSVYEDRVHNAGYTDIAKQIEEAIDIFSTYGILTYNNITLKYEIPVDCYYLDKVLYDNTNEIEKISHSKINNVLLSGFTQPSTTYPIYTNSSNEIQVYPDIISGTGIVTAQYIRYPLDPKWTWQSFTNGTPFFDPSAADYQDFELPLNYETDLVLKILGYAGISIREAEVVQAAGANELLNIQQKT